MEYSRADFDITKLGSFYTIDKTIFRIFAPFNKQMYLIIDETPYEMHPNGKCFEIGLAGDLEYVKYYYRNDSGIPFKDPFAYYSDDKYSYVLDITKFNHNIVFPNKLKDIIIYETSVRDFSSSISYTGEIKKKFLSLTETGLKLNDEYEIGLDYLQSLGISHIQLMPIFDYDNDGSDYNWGYNPLAYNYVKSDYIVNKDDPYAYINELRSVVNFLHEKNIRVSLDVVFNHVYKTYLFDLEKMIPHHVFRNKHDGNLANGTYCGNEIKSEDIFVREYLIEMVLRYILLFDIDGIRMDLMGILDYETVNQIDERCKAIKKDFIVYGEGWNMGEALDEGLRASIENADKMPGIAMFNDYFRDTIISYICGNDTIRADVKNVLNGSFKAMNYSQSINYVECHDNYTFYDRMIKFKAEDPEWVNIRRCKLALGLVVVARGLSFVHSGQEFLRTKNFKENSYNASEKINAIDWNLRVKNNELCVYFRDLLTIRKQNPVFICNEVAVSFEDYYECLIYKLNDLMIIINPSVWDHTYKDGHNYRIILDINGKTDYYSDILSIPAYSMIICKS